MLQAVAVFVRYWVLVGLVVGVRAYFDGCPERLKWFMAASFLLLVAAMMGWGAYRLHEWSLAQKPKSILTNFSFETFLASRLCGLGAVLVLVAVLVGSFFLMFYPASKLAICVGG